MGSRELEVLVAGGTGFLGRAFVRELAGRGRRVGVLTRRPQSVAALFPGLAVAARRGDVVRPETLPEALQDVHTVVQTVQFAGFPVEDPSRGLTFLEVDAAGTRNLVQAAGAARVQRIVYLSGVGASADAPESWFRAKAMAEEAVRSSGLAHTVIRPSWVYGPEDVSLNRFVSLVRLIPLVFPQIGDGAQRLNPVFVDDVARLVAELTGSEQDVAPGSTGRSAVLEIGGPETYTMDDIVRLVMEALGRQKAILHLPKGLALCGGALLELLPGRLLSRDALRFAIQGAVADNSALRGLLPHFRSTAMSRALATYLSD